jgi:predicted polyphosphate/ATP-dependent NAD kinase
MGASCESVQSRIGLIVNPVAGMGGKVALKGTDGAEALALAVQRGAVPVAPGRADRALTRLESVTQLRVLAASGGMGAHLATRHRFRTDVIPVGPDGSTTADDTRAAAGEMLRRGVDLLLFAGGDGTARDIHDAVGTRMTVLGIPTGVKMHSGVFAETPEAAGEMAAAFLRRPPGSSRVRDAEVADIDESALREDRIATRLYGQLRVPAEGRGMVRAKTSGPADDAALDALARVTARRMDPQRAYILGPGTTTARVLRALGLKGTLLGVDVVRDGRVVIADAGETDLLKIATGVPTTIIAGVVGGQGFLFGRGNQQISADVLRRVGVDNIEILADASKLSRLSPPCLRVDTGDQEVDRLLTGYRKVHVAPRQATILKITT